LKFLTTVESTLLENFAIDDGGKDTEPLVPALPNGSVSKETTGSSTKVKSKRKAMEDTADSDSKKKRRKTSEDGSAVQSYDQQKSSLEIKDLFVSLCRCLRDVVKLSKENSEAQVESLLKTDIKQAAVILGSWLSALNWTQLQPERVSEADDVYCIVPWLRIWESRSLQTQDPSDSSHVSSKLWPESILLTQLF